MNLKKTVIQCNRCFFKAIFNFILFDIIFLLSLTFYNYEYFAFIWHLFMFSIHNFFRTFLFFKVRSERFFFVLFIMHVNYTLYIVLIFNTAILQMDWKNWGTCVWNLLDCQQTILIWFKIQTQEDTTYSSTSD